MDPPAGGSGCYARQVAAKLNGIRVLIVEDHKDSQDILAMWLSHLGAAVQTADDGEEALALLSKTPRPHVILSDIHLPGMDGCALLSRLKSQQELAGIPVIAITGDVRFTNAPEPGFDSCLIKPVTGPIVGDAIARVLHR